MKPIAKFTSLALLVATLSVYGASRMETAVKAAPAKSAQTEAAPNTDIDLGAVKIGKSQNASIIAILATDPTGRDQRPVDIAFIFNDWAGNVLAIETKTIIPGQATSLDTQNIIRLPENQRNLSRPQRSSLNRVTKG